MSKNAYPPAEAAAFQHNGYDFLNDVSNAATFAAALQEEGVIGSEARSRVTSSADDEQKLALFDSVHQSLVNSSDSSRTLLSVRRAMETSGGATTSFGYMDRFVAGEWKIFCSLF